MVATSRRGPKGGMDTPHGGRCCAPPGKCQCHDSLRRKSHPRKSLGTTWVRIAVWYSNSDPSWSMRLSSPRLSSHIELSSRCAAPSAARRVHAPLGPPAAGGDQHSSRGPRAGWEEACQAQLPDQEDVRRHHHAANALGKYREPLRLPGRAWLGRAVSPLQRLAPALARNYQTCRRVVNLWKARLRVRSTRHDSFVSPACLRRLSSPLFCPFPAAFALTMLREHGPA